MPTELFVSRRGRQTWAALRENGKTTEIRAETAGESAAVGRIVRARVTRILPGIQSAFLDLGGERDGFLHVTDLWLPGEQVQPPFRGADAAEGEESVDEVPAPVGRPAGSAPIPRRGFPGVIEDRLKVGRELIVQVSRGSFGNKGARVTCYLALPGRLLVLFPQLGLRSVSRRIVAPEERARLSAILEGIAADDLGFVARTAAAGADEADLRHDAEHLLETYRELQRDAASGGPTGVLFGDVELALRLLRDAPGEGYARIVFDDPAMRDRATAYASRAAPELLSSIQGHQGPRSLFEVEGLDDDVDKALRPKVWLKSGGYVVIERTEALVSIDVNTGKFLGRRQLEETALETNLEAASEIARQLRLRDLGGIIVIDFIDMTLEESRQQVVAALTEALQQDRARTNIHELSALGLMQLTRKRTREAPEDLLTQRCSSCRGNGRVKRPETVAALASAHLLRLAALTPEAAFVLSAARPVLDALEAGGYVDALTPHFDVSLREGPELAPDHYDIRLIPSASP